MRLLLLVVLCGLIVLSCRRATSAEGTGPIAPGKDVPATFHPYNVTARIPDKEDDDEKPDPKAAKKKTYDSKGKYHCLISEYDLDPVVMLVARNAEDNKALAALLKKLDDAVAKNRLNRLRAFVVYQNDDLANVVKDDDKRGELAKKVQKVADDQKLQHAVLTLA